MSAEFSLLHKFRSRKNRRTKRLFDAMMDCVNPEIYEADNGLTIRPEGIQRIIGKCAINSYGGSTPYGGDYPYVLDRDKLLAKLVKMPRLSFDQLKVLQESLSNDILPHHRAYEAHFVRGYQAYVSFYLRQKDTNVHRWPVEPDDMRLEEHESIDIGRFFDDLSSKAKLEQPYLYEFLIGGAGLEYIGSDQVGHGTEGVAINLLMAGVGLATLHLEKHFELCTTEALEYSK